MGKVYFTDWGEQHEAEVKNGTSLMEAAQDNDVIGIAAECGGACACATCHVYVDVAWIKKCPEMDELEDLMLDHAYDRRDNSRLSCQLMMSNELDGIKLDVADND